MYVGVGAAVLGHYSLLSLLDPVLLGYLVLFYLLAYLVYGSLMLAVGAAVGQIAEAQSLMGSIMLLLTIPFALLPTIERTPDATLSVAMSFIPPMNSIAMLARLGSATPPPIWQVLASILAGLTAASITVWLAGKVFRIGLLMHGKPPNLETLIRWLRTD